MTRALPLLLIALLLSGCASIHNAREYATLALYAAEHKVLVFALTPCAPANAGKPAMVSAWVRERDIGKTVVVCDSECDCKLVKRMPEMKMVQRPEDGICR